MSEETEKDTAEVGRIEWEKLGLTVIIAGCACYATYITGTSQFVEAAWLAVFVWLAL